MRDSCVAFGSKVFLESSLVFRIFLFPSPLHPQKLLALSVLTVRFTSRAHFALQYLPVDFLFFSFGFFNIIVYTYEAEAEAMPLS